MRNMSHAKYIKEINETFIPNILKPIRANVNKKVQITNIIHAK